MPVIQHKVWILSNRCFVWITDVDKERMYRRESRSSSPCFASFGRLQSRRHHVSVKITGDDSKRPKPNIYSRHRRGQHRRNTRPYLIISDPSASGKQSRSRSGSDEFPINTLSFEHNFWAAVSWLAGLQLPSGLPGDTLTYWGELLCVHVQVLSCFSLWAVRAMKWI